LCGREEGVGKTFREDVVSLFIILVVANGIMIQVTGPVAGVAMARDLELQGDAALGARVLLVGDEVADGVGEDTGGVCSRGKVTDGLYHVWMSADNDLHALGMEPVCQCLLVFVGAGVILVSPVHESDEVGGGIGTGLANLLPDAVRVNQRNDRSLGDGKSVGAVGIIQ